MPPRFGNVGYRSSSSSSRRSPGTARQQQQRSQRTSSRGSQRGVSGKTTYVTSNKEQIDRNIKNQQQKNKIRDVKAEESAAEVDYFFKKSTQDKIAEDRARIQAENRQRAATSGPGGGPIPGQDKEDQQTLFNKAWALKKAKGEDLSNYSAQELQLLKDSGLFAMEASGTMDNFGMETVVNEMKKKILEGGAGYDEALAGLSQLHGKKDPVTGKVIKNEELAKINALGVQEYLNRKTKGDPDTLTDILEGKTGIEGLDPNFFKNLVYGGDDPTKSKQIGTGNLGWGTDKYGTYIGGDALGYDWSGTTHFASNEHDPEFRDAYYTLQSKSAPIDAKYLNLLKNKLGYSQSSYHYGGGGGGGGYGGWGSGGGGDGGGYGFSGQQDPMQRGYQRGQVGPGTLQEQVNQIYLGMSNLNPAPGVQKSRGGIVSLLGL